MLTNKKTAVRENGGFGLLGGIFEWNGNNKVGAGVRYGFFRTQKNARADVSVCRAFLSGLD